METVNHQLKRRRRAVSTAELYAVLEALLPFAEVDIECLSDYVRNFPDDPDHSEDIVRACKGEQAIEEARRLIELKSGYVRRKERALREEQSEAQASNTAVGNDGEPATTTGVAPLIAAQEAPHGH